MVIVYIAYQPLHDNANKMAYTCALSKDSDQPGHSSSQIRVFGANG